MVYVKDLMQLDFFQKNHIELLAGESGLERVVTRPNIAQLMSFTEWMTGGEFLLINGVGLGLDKLSTLLEFIEKANSKNAACIAFMLNDNYIKTIPREAMELADRLSLPIFKMPWEVSFGEILNSVYDFIVRRQLEETSIGELVNDILFLDVKDEIAMHRALFYGYDLTNYHRVIIFEVKNYVDYLERNPNEGNKILFMLKNQICYNLSARNEQLRLKVMAAVNNNDIVVMYPTDDKNDMATVLDVLYRKISASNPKLQICVGAGRSYRKVSDYKKSYREAQNAIKAAYLENQKIVMFENLGFFRLLVEKTDKDQIEEYVREILGPLMKYDHENGSQLMMTLEQFVNCNFNLAHTAGKLYIHRNTLVLRMEKIKDILKIDLEDSAVRRELANALYLNHFMG